MNRTVDIRNVRAVAIPTSISVAQEDGLEYKQNYSENNKVLKKLRYEYLGIIELCKESCNRGFPEIPNREARGCVIFVRDALKFLREKTVAMQNNSIGNSEIRAKELMREITVGIEEQKNRLELEERIKLLTKDFKEQNRLMLKYRKIKNIENKNELLIDYRRKLKTSLLTEANELINS